MSPAPAKLISHLRNQLESSAAPEAARSQEISFIIHHRTVHWSAYHKPLPHEPHSSVSQLIQGLFQRLHDQSFFILRKRIFSTSDISEFDRAMVKVTAKRISENCLTNQASLDFLTAALREVTDLTALEFVRETPRPLDPLTRALPTVLSELGAKEAPTTDGDWLKLCARLADSVVRGRVLHHYHRPLAALVTNDRGEILVAATHEGALDKTQHAELRAVQFWYATHAKPLPQDARAYVSLKPCRMCAAALSRVSENPDLLKMIYLNNDPGRHARHTALETQIEQKSASALTVLEGELEAFAKPPQSPRRN